MPVVMQASFRIEILPLKPQRLIKHLMGVAVESSQAAIGCVSGGPDDVAAVVGEFLRCAEVVELVVERAGLVWAFAVEHGERAESAGFVEVAAVVILAAFGDEVVALPEELGGFAIDGFADAAAEGVVAVGRLAAVGQGGADQPMLAVVAVFGDEFLRSAAALADQVAEGVVVVMAVALHQQAIAFDGGRAWAILHQQVAGRVVGEAFRLLIAGVADADQAVERIVLVAALAVTGVGDAVEIAVGAVGIVAAIQRLVVLADSVGFQTALVVVLILAEQQALLAVLFATGEEGMRRQSGAVEVDGRQCTALGVVVIEFAVVRQAQVIELTAGVIAIAQRAPALMLGDQPILLVVLELQRMVVAVVDADQSAEAVVAVLDVDAVGQGLDQQPSSRIPFDTP